MAGCWVGIATGLWPLSGPQNGYRGCQGAAVRPVGPEGNSIRREAEAKGRAFRFLCVRAPTADGWRGPPFFTCIRRWGYIYSIESISALGKREPAAVAASPRR